MIFLLIDDLDLALIIAAQNGFLAEAQQFYRLLLPSYLIQKVQEELGAKLKVVVMTERHVEMS
jgi:hypothetical protein